MKKISKFLSAILCLTLLLSVAVIPSVSADAAAATLTDLTFDGYTVPGFDPAVTEYTVTLPYRHYLAAADRKTATVTAVAEEGGTAIVSEPTLSWRTGKATVTAQKAGKTDRTYTINYTLIGDQTLGNPGFEAGDGWGWTNGDSTKGVGVSDGTAAEGDYYFNYTGTGGGNTIYQGVDSEKYDETVYAGWYYLTSGQFRVPAGSPLLPSEGVDGKKFMQWGAAGTKTAAGAQETSAESKVASTEWQRLTEVWKATTGDAPNAIGAIVCWQSAGNPYHVDDFYAGVLVAADINISGAPVAAITAATSVDLNATLINQVGTTHGMNYCGPVAWRLVNAPAGVSIDTDGVVTIAADTEFVGDLIVEATAATKIGPEAQWAYQKVIGERVSIPVNMPGKARLSDLTFDGYTVPGFDPKTTVYNVTLPYRHYLAAADRKAATVTAVAEDGGTAVVGTPTLNWRTGKVTVTAQKAGKEDCVYTINYSLIGDQTLGNPGFEAGDGYGWTNDTKGTAVKDGTAAEGDYYFNYTGTGGGNTTYQPVNSVKYGETVNEGWYYLTSGQFRVPAGSPLLANGDEAAKTFMTWGAGGTKTAATRDENSAEKKAASTEWQRLTEVWVTSAEPNVAGAVLCWQSAGNPYHLDDFYAGVLVAADINISGAPAVITEAGTVNLTAQIVNQVGTTHGMNYCDPVAWRLVSAPAGVSVNAETGAVTIPANCTGKIVVEATAATKIGPEAQWAYQKVIGERIELDAAVVPPATVTYGTDGDTVTPTINWFNATGASKTVRVYTAVYSLNGTKKVLEDVVVNDAVTVDNGALYNVALTPITKKADCTIETFVWTTDYRPLIGPFAY